MYLQNRLVKLVATGTLISFLAASCGKTNSSNSQPQSADTNPAAASATPTPPQQKASYLGVWREIDKDGKELKTVIKVTETTAQSCTLGSKPEEKPKAEEFSINPLNSGSFQRLSEDKQKVLETYTYSESNSSKYLEKSTEQSSTTASEQSASSSTASASASASATTTASTSVSTKFIAKETAAETEQLKLCFPDQTKPDPTKPDPTKPDPTKPDPTKPDPVKPDPVKPDPAKPDPVKPEPAKPSTPIVSTVKNIIDIVKQTDQKVKATNDVGEKIVAGFEAAGQVAVEIGKGIIETISFVGKFIKGLFK